MSTLITQKDLLICIAKKQNGAQILSVIHREIFVYADAENCVKTDFIATFRRYDRFHNLSSRQL